ncbi:MAG: valine--tRNA ligase [Pseudomonadota bacterium]|nr:valine--tRNA ligase [Pseudomonadota bacterium]
MEKSYKPAAIEKSWYQKWEEEGHFSPSGGENPYCIMIPPPNVTGTLHMGHAFQDTIMDSLTRYHRMMGYNTLWQPGTDHAGIATQMVVERQLEADNLNRQDLGRNNFLKKVWEWKEQSGNKISDQLRRMGASLDWERERFTMDEGLSEAVIEVFVRLYEEGLIYRGKRLVNWDPNLLTAVSDLEVIATEEKGHLWHFRYPLTNQNGYLVVATTRPETMLGDTAIAVNPDDLRYRDFIGQTVELPLCNRKIPVIADNYVDPSFGSGCVKITPAHDFNDYEIGKRHNLPIINIFTPSAAINKNAPKSFQGMDRYVARKKIVNELQAAGLVEKILDHVILVPRGDRSGEIIEPYLTDQWFVNTKPLAQPAINAVKEGRIKFIPENWSKTYFDWMENIQDWCISRQLWWGHRIPAWFDNEGKYYVGRSEDEVREKYQLKENLSLNQDEDVLDTWFSSALWPFSTLGWPKETSELKSFYPSTVLVTGFDIIFFWVARMIMMGLKFTGDVPFRQVYIHGLIRDQNGQKMSKSKGNVLDPLDLIDGIDLETLLKKRTFGLMQPKLQSEIEKSTRKEFPQGIKAFGTDALRFTFAALASTGRDIRFDMGRIEGYRNFCNKLWNASRFVLINITTIPKPQKGEHLSLPDRWIRSRFSKTITEVNRQMENYRLDLAAKALYEFTWNEYCDWYLELTKPVLQESEISVHKLNATRQTLIEVLEGLLRLLHPIIPFITEEIWQKIAPLAEIEGDTIMLQPQPNPKSYAVDQAAEESINWIMSFLLGVRQIRGEMDISPNTPLSVLVENASENDLKHLEDSRLFLNQLGRIESITIIEDGEEKQTAATALLGGMAILVPMAGIIDTDKEKSRLIKKSRNIISDLEKINAKLNNINFMERAPKEIIAKQRDLGKSLSRDLDQINEQLEKLSQI